MFKSANTTGALPLLEEVRRHSQDIADIQRLSWLPVDQAGRAVAEIVLSTCTSPDRAPRASVYHVLNPRISQWADVLAGLKQGGLAFDAVDRREWVRRLAASETDVAVNPTFKLLVSVLYYMCGTLTDDVG